MCSFPLFHLLLFFTCFHFFKNQNLNKICTILKLSYQFSSPFIECVLLNPKQKKKQKKIIVVHYFYVKNNNICKPITILYEIKEFQLHFESFN